MLEQCIKGLIGNIIEVYIDNVVVKSKTRGKYT